jgi:hypothetical protein
MARPALWPLGSVQTGQAGQHSRRLAGQLPVPAGAMWHASIPNPRSLPLPVWPADPPGLGPQSPRALLRAGAASPTLPFLGPPWVSPVDAVVAQHLVESGAAARQGLQAWLNEEIHFLQEQLGGARLEAGADRWEHPAEWAHPRFVRSYYLPPGSEEYYDALHLNESDLNIPSAADQPFASGDLPAHRQQSDPGFSSSPNKSPNNSSPAVDLHEGNRPNPDQAKASSSDDVEQERPQGSLGNHLAGSSDPAERRNIIPGLPVMFDDLPQDGKWKLLGKLTTDTTYAYKRTDDKEYLVMVNDGAEKVSIISRLCPC